jgi:hypothetical protein
MAKKKVKKPPKNKIHKEETGGQRYIPIEWMKRILGKF